MLTGCLPTEGIATADGYVKRPDRAKFTPSTLVQTLVYGWLAQPAASVEQLAQMTARLGVNVSPQAVDQCFTDATATLFHQVIMASIQHAIAADPVAIPILQRFTSVRVQDSTRIQLPDMLATTWRAVGNTTSAQACLKCGVQIDLLTTVMAAEISWMRIAALSISATRYFGTAAEPFAVIHDSYAPLVWQCSYSG